MREDAIPVERHPLEPFVPGDARVLFLGSFPPPRRRWCMPFFYPNYINDHWRIQGLVFYGDAGYFVDAEHRCFRYEAIVEHCERVGIAYYDTARAVRRMADNASDKFLEVVEATDVPALVAHLPHLRAIVTTGEKATETLCESLQIAAIPKVGAYVTTPFLSGGGAPVELYRLPSSSRAYPMSLQKKGEAYATMFRRYGLL